MRETRVCTHRFSAAIAVLLLAVILVLGAVPACFADPISVVDAGFEAGAEGAVLASPPWAANGTPQHREYDDARAKVGTKSAWIQGPATASNAGVYETSSAGMSVNGSEMRFWAYFDTANQSRLLDDYAAGVGGADRAIGIQFASNGAINVLTDRAGNPNGYTTGSYTTVGTYSTGWTEFRVVYTFTGTGAQTYTLSKRASSSESWTQLKAAGATGYAIPFKGANTITTTHGTLWRGYNGASIWVDDLRFSATAIKDAAWPTQWSGIQPTGTFLVGAPVTIQGSADPNHYALVASSAKLFVDGAEVPRANYMVAVQGASIYFYHVPTSLADGPHTFRAEVADAVGTMSSYEWGAIAYQPPTAAWISPAAGAKIFNGHPAISMSLADNTPLNTFSVTGQVRQGSASGPVAATFEGSGLTQGINPFIFRLADTGLAGDLAPGTYFLTATATDSSGGVASLDGATARSFAIVAPAAMTVLESCDGCHPTYRAAHPVRETPEGDAMCRACHPGHEGDHMQGTDNCQDCHQHWHSGHVSGGSAVTVTVACTTCHSADRPEVVQHTAASVASTHAGSCGGCHTNTSLTAKHGFTPAGSVYANQCDLCHAPSASARVRAAIAAGNTACNGCHDAHGADPATHTAPNQNCVGAACHSTTSLVDMHTPYVGAGNRYPQYADACALCHNNESPARIPTNATADCASCHPERVVPHGYEAAKHAATPANGVTISGTTFDVACSACHELELGPLHTTATCSTCHTSLVPALKAAGGWSKGCAQENCHAGTSSLPMHENANTAHTMPADKVASCIASGCHDAAATTVLQGKSLADIHVNASTTVDGETRASCQICHAPGVTPIADCTNAACHADRANPHGYPPEAHVASSSCVLNCHTATAGMTELKPLHDAAKGSSVACSACHPTKVNAIEPWDKTCTACHAIADLHASAAVSHTGTDVAYKEASFLGNGCTAEAGHTEMLACHTISNIAAVHSKMPDNGCTVCHGDGKTPAQECVTCHQPGDSNTYTTPAQITSAMATWYPSSDVYMTPGWTNTTFPTGQSRYAVVNTPYPPASTARYLTITSNTAGGVLFGFDRSSSPAIPDNATIVSVLVYAKGKATVANQRKMQGLFRVGGTDYQTGNLSSFLPSTGFLGGTGAGQQLASSPILGYDYSFDMYGTAIYGNPKTGARWTPAQLNGTDTNGNNLEAFGVALTSSAAANNVSLAQVYARVWYYVNNPGEAYPTVGTHTYHQDNVKYLHNPADAAGKRFATSAPNGWYDALYFQDCYDFCHRGNGGQPTFSATQGSWMWYSVAGDPGDTLTQTRYLTLKPITVPAASPTLSFQTRYGFGGADVGRVQISTDGGSTWTALTGTVGGSSMSTLSGSSGAWVPATYNLSAYAGQSVKLRFLAMGSSSATLGWALDSVAITGDGATLFSDDAETLKPDWTSTWWTRSMGAFPYQ